MNEPQKLAQHGTLILDDRHSGAHTYECETFREAAKSIATKMGLQYQEGAIVGCESCGHLSCVCGIITMHNPGCPFRIASTCSVAVECEHGYDVCPQCDPCTCTE